jgi:haloacetate dehalogenase
MAKDMVEVMDALGHRRFHVVGHDRGGRVAHRLARDRARRVHTLTVLDISPTLKVFESTDMRLATAYYHWFLMLQPAPLPEQMLAGRVPFYILGRVGSARADLSSFSREAVREYMRCFKDPRAIHASCEDYRAAGTIDLDHDRRDRGKKLAMPVLALWGGRAVVGRLFDCLADWREVAENVTGRALDCGHFIPEEAPAQTIAELERFLRRHPMEGRP